jgi:hypothetical protein
MRRFAAAALLGMTLAVLTTVTYLAFLAWDQHKDIDPFGNVTGPYQAWQIVGVVLALGAVAGMAGWHDQAGTAIAVIPTVFTTCWIIDAVTDEWNDGLWPIGAGLVAIGSFLGIGGAALVAMACRAHFERRAPSF